MSKDDMLGKLIKLIIGLPVEVIGTLYDLAEKLGGKKEGKIWLAALKRFLRKENPWEEQNFKYDYTNNGWNLLENVPFLGAFIPEIKRFSKEGEDYVSSKKMRQRAKELNADLGQLDAEYLFQHQELIPKEWREYVLIFTGTVWLDNDSGYCRIPMLQWRDDGGWHLELAWLRDYEDWWAPNGRLCSRK